MYIFIIITNNFSKRFTEYYLLVKFVEIILIQTLVLISGDVPILFILYKKS